MASAEQLIEVFNAAKLRPAGPERDAFLAEACGDDTEWKEQVLSLLKAHENAGDFLQAHPPMLDTEMMRLKPEKAGGRIGPYTLREQLGEGGFGTVWVAEQHLPVRRTVALKIIKLGMDTKDVVARFEQERQALAVMDHPNIAKVLDAGATEEGRPYFVMELVRGIRITDYCDQANLPTPDRLALFMQVCHAVQHAHQKGIIHRDLKPSNILVTLQDGVPVPKVIDFGVAKATQGPLTELTIYTRALEMVGTPLYMSPEQAEMNGLDVDTRTDIYALGVLLYELLTGRTPFDADTLRKAGYDEVRRIIREQEPQQPSKALHTMAEGTLTSVAQHRASEAPKLIHAIRGDLDWIVMKCLEKDRARRYDTANGLALDLERHLKSEVVLARPPTTAYLLGKFIRRNRVVFAAGASVIAALVIGIAISIWQAVRATEAGKVAIAEAQRATAAEERAARNLSAMTAERDAKEAARKEAATIATFMSEVFESPDPYSKGRMITVAENLDNAVKKVDKDLAGQPRVQAKLRETLGITYQRLGLYTESISLWEKAQDYYLSTVGPEHPDTLEALAWLGRGLSFARRFDEATRAQEQALNGWLKTAGRQSEGAIRAMRDLGAAYRDLGRQDEALKLQEEAYALSRAVFGPEHHDTLWVMQALAGCLFETPGRRAEATKLREDVYAIRQRVSGPKSPATLISMLDLGNSYLKLGRASEALPLLENCAIHMREVLSSEHTWTLRAIDSLAWCYELAGRLEDGLKRREEAVGGWKKAVGVERIETCNATRALANTYARLGRTQDAMAVLTESSIKAPGDTRTALALATLQAWFGLEAEHGATCARLLKWAADTEKLEEAERVTKIVCLRPIEDALTREATLLLARRALELEPVEKGFVGSAQMTLGMAEYRSGNYPAADRALTTAINEPAGPYTHFAITASFYHVMSLFQQRRPEEARELLVVTTAKMKRLPADDKNPLADGRTTADHLVVWLAYKEARALLDIPPDNKR